MIDRLIIVVKLLIPILGIALIFYISYLVFEGWDSVTAEWIRLIGRLEEPEKFLFYGIQFNCILTLIQIIIISKNWKMFREFKKIYKEGIIQK